MSAVLFNSHSTADGQIIMEVVLNAERSLNALSLEMIGLIGARLTQWEGDDQVRAVVLRGAGSKAFCAGGDVVALYHALKSGSDRDTARRYFEAEYRLDYQLHTYSKPLICWGDGIVMGGGMGLLSGCSQRVVTEHSMLAMPEVTIGLFPDVGASWFLNRLPGRLGLFLAMTGNPVNAADAIYLGLADRFITSDRYAFMLEQLCEQVWTGEDAERLVSRVLRTLEAESKSQFSPHSPVRDHFDLIQDITDQDSVDAVVEALLATETNDKWIERAQNAVRKGSALSLWLIDRQLRRCRSLSLRECFAEELNLAVQCALHREFSEGVRALLVDKDRKPQWTFASAGGVSKQAVDQFFEPVWPESPLADLPKPDDVVAD
ncbi:MAG: enoyl-CoA hydratase [Oceanospirillaceae bacterium]|nr:enoyl-CoA hydratase [Oceanospirillaceae bacterium]